MMRFQNKKVLILGSNVGSKDIIQYAKQNGAKTYVADYFDAEKSEAKKEADVPVDISTADVDALSNFVEQEKIDAVFSGISGFNITKAMELSQRFGMSYYCNKKQWEALEHKDNFRNLCKRYSVPCPITYYCGQNINDIPWGNIFYPVIVKPVDSGASAGVHICESSKELKKWLDDAFHHSEKKKVIIEQFVEGEEFTAHYSIFNGNPVLSCMDNRYPVAVNNGKVTTIPIARIYPSTFLRPYLEQVNPAMIKLVKSIGIDNGVIFIQGLYNAEKDSFSIFEAGCRSAAEAPYRFLEKTTGNNYLKMMVDTSLGVVPSFNLYDEDPNLHGKKCAIVSFVTRGGKVGTIRNLEEAIKACQSVVDYENRYPVGAITPSGDTLHQIMIRFIMVSDDIDQIKKEISYLNKTVSVLDENGENMVIKFDPGLIEPRN